MNLQSWLFGTSPCKSVDGIHYSQLQLDLVLLVLRWHILQFQMYIHIVDMPIFDEVVCGYGSPLSHKIFISISNVDV